MMTHTYQLEGMTCSSCENKVKNNLLIIPDVNQVDVSKENNSATINMNKHISLEVLQEALGGKTSKYQIALSPSSNAGAEETRSWIQIYKPILLIFCYVTLISGLATWQSGGLNFMMFMRIFMAGFFLTFSFFKLLNLKGFAESYAMYDIVAKKFAAWGYVYAFIELALGVSYALNIYPVAVNWITLIVMAVSVLGVLESVLNKKKIQCACLGAVFNLPMSTVTIVEDTLMIAMSAGMLIMM